MCDASVDFTLLHFLQYIIINLEAGRRAHHDKDVSLFGVVFDSCIDIGDDLLVRFTD